MGEDYPLLLSVPEAAKLIGISERRLYLLAGTPGVLPEGLVVRLGRSVRISRPRLRAWLSGGERKRDSSSTEWHLADTKLRRSSLLQR